MSLSRKGAKLFCSLAVLTAVLVAGIAAFVPGAAYAQAGIVDMQVQSSAALVQAVASGSADAGIALGDNVVQAVDQGASVVITGAILQKPVLRFIGTVNTIPELRGKRLTAGAVDGGTTDL